MTTGSNTHSHQVTIGGKTYSTNAKAHTHSETPDPDAAAIADLTARVAALEAKPAPGPTPLPPSPAVGLQALIDGTATGGTLTVPVGTYRESVTISRPMTVNGYGAIIDGRDAAGTTVRSSWLTVSANDVTVRGFAMQHAAGDYSTQYSAAGVQAFNVTRFHLIDCELSDAFVNISLIGSSSSSVEHCNIHDARHLGVRAGAFAGATRAVGQSVINSTLRHNNRAGVSDPDADGGNLKATFASALVLSGNDVSDSTKGLWLDVACLNAVLSGNRIHDHDSVGIHDETSVGTKIHDNALWRNASHESFFWAADILVAASQSSEVYANTMAYSPLGVSFVSQNRADDPGMTGNYSHDNTTIGATAYGSGWFQDWAGVLFAPAANNRGALNRYWQASGDGPFAWNGSLNLADYNATPGEENGRYLTAAEKDAALAAAGIP